MSDCENTTQNQNNNNQKPQQKLTPDGVTNQIKAQIKEAKLKSVKDQAKKILEDIAKTEGVLKQQTQSLELLYAENPELFVS